MKVSRKEKHYVYDDCCIIQWSTVRLFAWGLSHGMGMVAEK